MKKLIEFILGLFKKPVDAPKNISQDCIELIKHFEGLRLKAYKDPVGVWTIGYGDTQNVTKNMVITQAQAEERLLGRIARDFEPAVLAALTTSVTQKELDALVSFAYNVGVHALQTSTLLKRVNENKPLDAAKQFDRWVYANKKVLRGLVKRRAAEKTLFLGGTLEEAFKSAEQA